MCKKNFQSKINFRTLLLTIGGKSNAFLTTVWLNFLSIQNLKLTLFNLICNKVQYISIFI